MGKAVISSIKTCFAAKVRDTPCLAHAPANGGDASGRENTY